MPLPKDAEISDVIEDYMLECNYQYEKLAENTWTIHDEIDNVPNIVVHYSDPTVIFRVKLMDIPTDNKAEFMEKLLRFNVERMTYGAYAFENDIVVISNSLEAENLDLNEFQSTVDSIVLAIAEDHKELFKFANS